MLRRDLSKLLAAGATGAVLLPENGRTQTPVPGPSHSERTPEEIKAGVTPVNPNYPPGNVLRHGADPTGSASSDRALADAIRVATVAQSGGLITLPPGAYTYSSGLSWNAPNVNIVGTGTWDSNQMPAQPAPTTLNYTGNGEAITVGRPYSNGATPYGGMYFSSFKLKGNASATNGIHLYYSTTAKLERMLVRDFTRRGAAAVYADNRWQDITVLDWIEFNNNYTGLALAAVNDSTQINNCEFQYHTGPAVVLGQIAVGTTSHVVSFNSCQFAFNGGSLRSGPADVQILSGNTINFLSCYFENGLAEELYSVVVGDVTNDRNSTIVRNINFFGCLFQGSKINRYAVQVANNRVYNLNFYGCTFLNFTAAAIDNSFITDSQGSIYVDPGCSLNGTPQFFANNAPAAGRHTTSIVPAVLGAIRSHRVIAAEVSAFTAIAPGSAQTRTVTVAGVVATDFCLAMPSAALQTGLVLGYAVVSGANTVELELANVTSQPITPTAMGWKFLVVGQ